MVLGRRIDYLSPTLYATDVLVFAVVFLWLVEKVSRKAFRVSFAGKKAKHTTWVFIKHAKYLLPVLVFIAGNVWFADSRPVALLGWIKLFEYLLLGWYVISTKPGFLATTSALVVGVWYTSIIALWQFVLQHSIGGFAQYFGERTFALDTPGIARLSWCVFPTTMGCRELLRAYATLPHPNVLGGYIAVTMPLILRVLHTNKLRVGMRFFYSGALILGAAALLVSFSRSAWLVAGLGMSMMYVAFWKNKRKHVPLFAFAFKNRALGALVVAFVVLAVVYRPGIMDESMVQRAALNKAAIHMWQRSPFWGVGMHNYLVALPATLPFRQINVLQPAHNMYLLALSEIGVFGAGLLAFGIFALIRQSRHARTRAQHYVSVVSILLLGFVDHYFVTLQQGQLLFVIIAAFYIVDRRSSPHARDPLLIQ